MIAAAVDFFTPDIKTHFTQQVGTDREKKKNNTVNTCRSKTDFSQIRTFNHYSYEDGLKKHDTEIHWCYCYTGAGSHYQLCPYLFVTSGADSTKISNFWHLKGIGLQKDDKKMRMIWMNFLQNSMSSWDGW